MSAKHSETHSALPFAVGSGSYNERNNKYDVVITSQSRDVCTMELYYDDAEANAAYIVRACNAHEALVDALTEAQSWLREFAFSGPDEDENEGLSGLQKQIEGALKLAQGEQP